MTVARAGFSPRAPKSSETMDSPPLQPDLPAQTGLAWPASILLYFISFCHSLKEKDSRLSPNSFSLQGRGCQPEGADAQRLKGKEKTQQNITLPERAEGSVSSASIWPSRGEAKRKIQMVGG